ncbi:MAG: zf-TFIIB domain-containing protein [Alphaproteobacteria bacterium]|nr:zf-TFIIB domain-containing protein [Alphaproteobacteria bacterium]
MQCPRNHGPLDRLAFDRRTWVDWCPACGGAFYERGELERALGHAELSDRDIVQGGTQPRAGCTCPGCGEKMTEYTWPTWTDIRLDVCGKCGGRWLDRGELESIKTALDAVDGDDGIEDVDFKQVKLEDGTTAVVPFKVAVDPGIKWGWVFGGAVFIFGSWAAVKGVLGFLGVLDAAANADAMGPAASTMVAAAVGFPIGGAIAGRASPGFTVIEPAIAAAVSALIIGGLSWSTMPAPWIFAMVLGGFLLALLGGWVGERLSS